MKPPDQSAWQWKYAAAVGTASLILLTTHALAVDGGAVRVATVNGWKAFEVISQNDDPSGDGFSYAMPGNFDGAGAWLVDDNTLRVQVNHEIDDASISEVNLDLAALQTAIDNVINNGNTGAVRFVNSARQAYSRWSSDGGISWTDTSSASNTSFYRLCSSQAYAPDTFGTDRGFVDHIYITGEEGGTNRLFALDSVNRDLYQLSGVTGSAPGGIGGMSFDEWENAALIDTGETAHVALVLSADGGSTTIKLYIGEKGKDASGLPSNSFLARNGLAYGSWFYLNSSLPGSVGGSNIGSIDTSVSGALAAPKMEDVDTSPSNPTSVVLGNEINGVYTLDFGLAFPVGGFDAGASSFTITKISDSSGGINSLNGPDNVDWTAATTLGTDSFPQGLIFVNEDTVEGEIWQMNPDGSNKIKVGQTTVGDESSGIFDLSEFVGYAPGAVLITNNFGSTASMTVLIHPSLSSPGGPGISLSLTATEDTFVSSSQSNSNFDGSSEELLADGGDSTYGELMSLIRFDTSEILQCASVSSATLALNLFNTSTGTYGVYEAASTWSSSSATWNSVGGAGVLGTELATFAPSSTGTVLIPLNASGIGALNAWVQGTNFGFVIASTGTTDGTDFYSIESGNAAVLDVTIDDSGCTGENVAPVAGFTFSTSDLTASFVDGSLDNDGSVASWFWDFGDGNTSIAQNPSHTYAVAASYTVTLTVMDDAGADDSTSQSVTVTAPGVNDPPTAAFTFSTSDLTASFVDGSLDNDGSLASWFWDFGDGNTSVAQSPSHTYALAGSYTVTLTVMDDEGADDSTSQTVIVSDPAADIWLTVDTSKARGSRFAALMWGGATSANVDVYWDGALVETTANDGAETYVHNNGKTRAYTVCEAGSTTICSPAVVASW